MLASPTSQINDIVIDGSASIMKSMFDAVTHGTSSRCALLLTSNIPDLREGLSDEHIWRTVAETEYWKSDKDIWILPIHRQYSQSGHWVLCVAYTRSRKLLLFDSLGNSEGWLHDLEVSEHPSRT